MLAMVSANRRGASLRTGAVPVLRDVVNVGLGLLIYALVAHYHGQIFGVASGVL